MGSNARCRCYACHLIDLQVNFILFMPVKKNSIPARHLPGGKPALQQGGSAAADATAGSEGRHQQQELDFLASVLSTFKPPADPPEPYPTLMP